MSPRLLQLMGLILLAVLLGWAYQAWLDPTAVVDFLNQRVLCN
ncbi:MAG: hypothetical protein PHU46_00070 [Rhodocyclaceae bacterium]|nr:hypothetical protein [Rhodocyclaceae bacterium]